MMMFCTQNFLDEDQRLYLSEECQKSVRESLKGLEEGRFKAFDNIEDLIQDLRS